MGGPGVTSLRAEDLMRNVRGTNITIFIIFFGLSLLEAVQTRNWFRAALWLALGFVFLWADGLPRRR
jgi:hypothetical protein